MLFIQAVRKYCQGKTQLHALPQFIQTMDHLISVLLSSHMEISLYRSSMENNMKISFLVGSVFLFIKMH